MRIRALSAIILFTVVFAAAAEPFRIGVLRGPTAIAFAPLIEAPPVMADGREVQFLVMPSPDLLVARAISGEVDAAALPGNVAAQLHNRGVELQVAATFIWGVLYLLGPPGAGIHDLEGREIYAPGRGATPDLVLRYILEANNLSDVTVRYGLGQVELAQLLIAGRVELAVLPEPFVTRVLRATRDRVVVADLQELWLQATGLELPQTVLVTFAASGSTRYAGELCAMLSRSVDTLMADPERAIAGVEALGLGLDAETALAALPRLNLRVESGPASRPALERYLEALRTFDEAAIGGPVPGGAFYGL